MVRVLGPQVVYFYHTESLPSQVRSHKFAFYWLLPSLC
jgi:hypothetical protein